MVYKNMLTGCCLLALVCQTSILSMASKLPTVTPKKAQRKIQMHNWRQGAERGKLSALRGGFYNTIAKFKRTNNIDDFEAAMLYHFISLIRASQDIACCKNITTVQNAVNEIRTEHNREIAKLIAQQIIPRELCSKEKNKERIIKALAWVQQRTTSNQLSSPGDIRAYGFNNHFSKPFISHRYWQKKRQAVLNQYYREFNIRK